MKFSVTGRFSLIIIMYIIYMVFLKPSELHGQTFADSSLIGQPISSIEIAGNEKTKSYIILREMKQKVGDRINLQKAEEDRKRIQNLGIFNRVMIIFHKTNENNIVLNVLVTEQWTIIPFPIFYINDKDWNKLTYGLGLLHTNFRGRKETLSFGFWLGYDPGFRLDYINPWIPGTHYLQTSFGCYHQSIRSKHFQNRKVNENHSGLFWSLGKRIGYHLSIHMIFGYKEITSSPSQYTITRSKSGKDQLPIIALNLELDYRDLIEYPHKGIYLQFFAEKIGFPSMTANYFYTGIDAKKYFPVTSKTTLAFRSCMDFSFGAIPIYDRLYLGYSKRIRGHFFEKFEGENRALFSTAFHFPILPVEHFNISETSYLHDLKFGMSGGLFVDSGLTWFQHKPIRANLIQSGWGLGLHLHLPYIDLLRVELAFDEDWNSQWIADLFVDI